MVRKENPENEVENEGNMVMDKERKEAWCLLKTMKPSGNEGWCIVGDFNEIITNDGKWGGKARPENQMEMFREFMRGGNLFDLGWRGDKFTWSNSYTDATFTKERLDRAVANPQWMNTYTESWVEVMVARTSDHKPLKAFQRWNKNKKQMHEQEVEEKTKTLQLLQAMENGSNVEELRKVTKELHLELEKEDLWWKQRAKRSWLFQTTNPSQEEIEMCLVGMSKRVTTKMNRRLSRRFTPTEVEEVVKQMAPLKAPGPDGFGPCFYQNHWDVVSEEVCRAALDILNGNPIDPGLNYTYLALIPKSVNPKKVIKYRPISLCNVMYKIVSKAISNRFKLVLSEVISPSQSAFLPGRLINDNVIVAYELLHSMKSRKKGRIGSMAMKLDMSKAFDRVEWDVLKAVLTKLGFCKKWTDLVMKCGLSSLLDFYEKSKLIRGVQVARGGTSINHLLFTDDCILFGRANIEEWRKIQEILLVYEKASGQFLNKGKTSVFFSNNTQLADKQAIKEAGNSFVCGTHEKYLGLPAMVGKSRYNTFRNLKEKIWQKISSWKNIFLSQAGKEVLIKAVLQSIPTFTMGVFKLPIELCKEINGMLSKFWWGSQQEGRGMVWKKWKNMNIQKGRGGMGFRDLESFNAALLAKQGWRILKYPLSLAAVLLKEKYFRHGNFLDAKLGAQPSLVWRSIWSAKVLLREGLRWKVGDGKKINIWGPKCLTSPTTFAVQSPVSLLQKDAKVEELIDRQKGEWNETMIRTIFSEEEVEQILCMPLSRGRAKDKIFWGPTKKGLFTVRSAYFLHMELKERNKGESSTEKKVGDIWKSIWDLEIPGVTKLFLWKAANSLLPTKVNLYRRNISMDKRCPMCDAEEESLIHILWECPAANDLWGNDASYVKKWTRSEVNFLELWEQLRCQLSKNQLEEVAVMLRKVWLRRNEWIFEKRLACPRNYFITTRVALQEFQEIQVKASQNRQKEAQQRISV
ncbi:uncharacterized protein LOC121234565 [Juglans microcarpa x Juglans regia]|uniref:uncharacterized protein LOC121234565 n=1 Tax=Juglans microcarpa x Juglans regia TaxID=2249226 RepID=UPI001B7E22FF|nr:uncharacterized protein LOC121234565 [Juglans microcarpa x Juglans regia]